MDSRLTILEELRQISPLVAGIDAVNLYGVPEGYFEGLADQLLLRINTQDPKQELENLSPLLSGISKQVPYQLPDSYFVDLSDQALVGAKAIDFVNEELENLSPLMSGLKAKNVYEVPTGYFETLAENILMEARKQQPARVISMRPVRKIMRYAVAAVVIGIMAVGAWFIQQPENGSIVSTQRKVETGIQKASDEEILNFIQNDEAPISEAVLNTNDEMDEADVKSMLADIPDSELEEFAKEFVDQNNTLSN